MKKNLYGILAFVVFAIAILPAMLVAQGSTYTVKQGDTLWKLRGAQWEELVRLNPQIPVRRTADPDKVYADINVGDEIKLTTQMRETIGAPLPPAQPENERLVVPPPAPIPAPAPQVIIPQQAVPIQASGFPWGWIMLTVALLAIIVYLLGLNRSNRDEEMRRLRERLEAIERDRQAERQARELAAQIERLQAEAIKARQQELDTDPIKSGASYLEGGIPENATPDQIRDFVREAAVRQILRSAPVGTIVVPRDIEIVGNVERVALKGEGNVFYRGTNNPERRNLTGTTAYRARTRVAGSQAEPREVTILAGNLAPIAPLSDTYVGFEAIPAPLASETVTDPVAVPAAAEGQVSSMEAVPPTAEASTTMDAVPAANQAAGDDATAVPAADDQAINPVMDAIPMTSKLIFEAREPLTDTPMGRFEVPLGATVDVMSMESVEVRMGDEVIETITLAMPAGV